MSDSIKPWTIRSIPPEERDAASEAARRSDLTLGEWLSRAIRGQIQRESQEPPVAGGHIVVPDVMRIAGTFRDLAAAGVPISKANAKRLCKALLAPLPSGKRPLRRKPDNPATEV